MPAAAERCGMFGVSAGSCGLYIPNPVHQLRQVFVLVGLRPEPRVADDRHATGRHLAQLDPCVQRLGRAGQGHVLGQHELHRKAAGRGGLGDRCRHLQFDGRTWLGFSSPDAASSTRPRSSTSGCPQGDPPRCRGRRRLGQSRASSGRSITAAFLVLLATTARTRLVAAHLRSRPRRCRHLGDDRAPV